MASCAHRRDPPRETVDRGWHWLGCAPPAAGNRSRGTMRPARAWQRFLLTGPSDCRRSRERLRPYSNADAGIAEGLGLKLFEPGNCHNIGRTTGGDSTAGPQHVETSKESPSMWPPLSSPFAETLPWCTNLQLMRPDRAWRWWLPGEPGGTVGSPHQLSIDLSGHSHFRCAR